MVTTPEGCVTKKKYRELLKKYENALLRIEELELALNKSKPAKRKTTKKAKK